MKNLVWITLATIMFAACGGKNSGFKKATNGTLYKITNGNSKDSLLKVRDGIAFAIVERFGDSIGQNSYEEGHQYSTVDTTSRGIFDYSYVFSKMKVGDSATIKLSVDSIYNTFLRRNKEGNPKFDLKEFNKNVPPFFTKKGSFIVYGVKVLDRYVIDPSKPQYAKDTARASAFFAKQTSINQAYQLKKATKNLEDGEKFLAANKSKTGVITTPSGLQYKIIAPGAGNKPVATDMVKLNYAGKLISGQEFDNSKRSGGPVPMRVNGTVPGFSEALQLMPLGSKFKVWIPSKLGYADQGNEAIPANSVLEFDLELVEIMDAKAVEEMMKQQQLQQQMQQQGGQGGQGGHSANDGHGH